MVGDIELTFNVLEDKYPVDLVLNRTELHRKVWASARWYVAREYGIGDHHLRKACDALRIPLPPSDHWRMLELGKPSPVTPLPEDANAPETARLTFNLKSRPGVMSRMWRGQVVETPKAAIFASNNIEIKCSSCGKQAHQVRKFIAMPTLFMDSPIYVCDDCVERCVHLLGSHGIEFKGTISPLEPKLPPPDQCWREALDRIKLHDSSLLKLLENYAERGGLSLETLALIKLETHTVASIVEAKLALKRLTEAWPEAGRSLLIELLESLKDIEAKPIAEEPNEIRDELTTDRHKASPKVAQQVLRDLGVHTSRAVAKRVLDDLNNRN